MHFTVLRRKAASRKPAYTSGPIRSEDQASATIDVSGIKVLFLWYIYYYYYTTTA